MQPATPATPATPAVTSPGNPILPGQPVAPPSGNKVAASTSPAHASQPLLYQACRDGDTTAVKRLLAAGGIDVNAVDPHTRLAPLMLAARHGHDDVALVLMKGQQGANVNLQNSRGDTALSLAAAAGRNDVLALLLERKADPAQAGHCGRTPLAEAVAGGHLTTVGLLLERGASADGGGEGGKPPLTIAARRGDGVLAALLLENKASLDLADRHGWTAFHHASAMGHVALAEQLRGKGAAPAPEPAAQRPEADGQPVAGKESVKQATQGVVPGSASTVTTMAMAATMATATTASTTATATTTATSTATTVTSIVATQPAYVAPAAPAMPAMPVGPAMESPTALRKAVERNDVEALHQIIAADPGQPAVLNQPIAFTRQRGPLPAGSYTLLMLAAVHGHVAMVEALLALGAEVNARGSGEASALLLAVRHRQIDTAEALLKAGAEVDAQTADGDTAVMLALARRDAAAVRALLAGVGNPEDVSACLRQAAASGYVNTVRLLIRAGAEVNGFEDVKEKKREIWTYDQIQDTKAQGSYYQRSRCEEFLPYYDGKGNWNPFAETAWAESLALFRAARNGHTGIVRMLLDAGARLDRGFDSQELMLNALQNGHIDIMRMLLEGRSRAPFPYSRGGNDNDFVKTDMEKVFTYAINGNKLGILQALLDMPEGKAAVPRTPAALNAAVQRSNLEIARKLLDAGADPNKPAYNQYPVVLAVESGNRKMLEMLIKADAIPELALQHGNDKATLLQHAVRRGHREIVQIILSLDDGAHCDKADVSEALALNGAMSCAQLLLNAGAEPNWKGKNGRTALSQAVSGDNKAVVELLLRHKAQVDLAFASGSIELTPLADAAYRGHTGIVRLLLESGADRTLKDSEGKTAVHRAIESNNKEVVDLLRNWKPNASS